MDDPLIDRLFIGAGAMKAGTTWLYSVLDKHPQIFFSLEKEIHYFYARHVRADVLSEQARLANAQNKYLRFDPAHARADAVKNRLRWAANYLDGPVDDHWYRGLFAFRRGQAWCADFSNLYALLPARAWTDIANRVGALRVLYTMRDPVERLWSHMKFHLAITGQAEALDRWRPDDVARFIRQPFIWDNAEYGAAIRRMRAGLPEGALLLAFHEEIHDDEPASLRRIESHLEIPHFDYPDALLYQRVNSTPKLPIPDWFRELLAADVARIGEELADAGLTLPDAWGNPADDGAPARRPVRA